MYVHAKEYSCILGRHVLRVIDITVKLSFLLKHVLENSLHIGLYILYLDN